MVRTRSAGAEATAAPAPAPEAANPSASAVQPSAETGTNASAVEVEHTATGEFEVSLEGLGASSQDIEALRRIHALIRGKAGGPARTGGSTVFIASTSTPAAGRSSGACSS
jgi:hypothetical protein